jgi:hypothetical protein
LAVELQVFDVMGRRVVRLFEGQEEAGEHSLRWPLLDDSGRRVSPGLYFVRLRAGALKTTRRVIVVQ